MLTTECKQILDYLIQVNPSNRKMIDSNTIAKDVKLPVIEVETTLNYLDSQDYLKLKRYKNGGFVHALTHKAFHYKEFEHATPVSTQTNIFNAPVTGSAIGNVGTITISNGISFQEARDFIQSQSISAEDKVKAEKVIDYIETLTENEAPLKKGALSKFSDILSKLQWLPELAMKLLLVYLTER